MNDLNNLSDVDIVLIIKTIEFLKKDALIIQEITDCVTPHYNIAIEILEKVLKNQKNRKVKYKME